MTSIPRVIHRVWVGAEMPDEFAAFESEWTRLNPGWRVRTWRERDIEQMRMTNADLYERAPDMCPEKFIPRFRSNLVRYEILERHGGVYVDCDLRPLAPLPDLDGISAFAGWEKHGEWVGNSILGAAPQHPFFAALVDGAAASCERYGPERSPITTGPQYLTRTYVAAERNGGSGLHVYPEPVFYPRSWRDLGAPPAPLPAEAITDHLWAALRGSVSVIIPYRPDGAERDRNLAWVLARLHTEHPDWQIIVQEEPEQERTGLFNRAALIRQGVARSFGDIIIVHDGDVWCPGLPAAVAHVTGGARWAVPHTKVHRLTPDTTAQVIDGTEPDDAMPCHETPYDGTLSGGAVVLTRATAIDIPPDDRFEGWGGEDAAWGRALLTLAGACWRAPDPLFHLWHPPQPRLSRAVGSEANDQLLHRYQHAAASKPTMAALVSELRDGSDPPTVRTSPSGWWRHTTGRIRYATAHHAAAVATDPAWQPAPAP